MMISNPFGDSREWNVRVAYEFIDNILSREYHERTEFEQFDWIYMTHDEETQRKVTPEALEASMLAPCGMNCGICVHYLSEKRACNGCNGDDDNKPKHCIECEIKKCALLEGFKNKFCSECVDYPCKRLIAQDEHELNIYGFSLIENLENIRDLGIDRFLATERERWRCEECGGLISVYSEKCLFCGRTLRY